SGRRGEAIQDDGAEEFHRPEVSPHPTRVQKLYRPHILSSRSDGMTLSLAPLALARSEQDLVAATRSGQDRAFEELYSRYRDRIAAFILAKVHDHARAEDIAQDVFISALRRLRASDQEIAFKPWIYEIAKNACIDEFRRTKRAHEVSLEADEELGGDRRALLSVAPTPLAAVESKQSLTDL